MDWDCAPIYHGKLFADTDCDWARFLKEERNIDIMVSRKRLVNEPLCSGNCLNTTMSSRRHPIESFFHWIDVKFGIQNASHIRSLAGLLFHLFASLAFIALSLAFYYWFALYNALVARLQEGDILVVESLDRFARNYIEIQNQW